MSRHFSKPIIRSDGAWPLIAAAASLALTSCAAPQQRIAAAAESAGTYVAVDQSERSVFAQTSREGSFVEAHGCLAFKVADSQQMLTPIFPGNGTSFVSDGTHTLGMVVNGSEVSLGKFYKLNGQVPIGSNVNTAAGAVPVGCPTNYFLVASVSEASSEYAGLHRFCARTTLCYFYMLD